MLEKKCIDVERQQIERGQILTALKRHYSTAHYGAYDYYGSEDGADATDKAKSWAKSETQNFVSR
jgi:hypothetical protein